MKKSTLFSTIAALALGAIFVTNSSAGTLTLLHPASFGPDSAFTNNSITAMQIQPDLVRLVGDSDVRHEHIMPRVKIGGDFSADAGDVFTITYDFSVDLNSTSPVRLVLGARVYVSGVPETVRQNIFLQPGMNTYQGTFSSAPFSVAESGTWKGRLFFGLTNRSGGHGKNLTIDINKIDFQIAPVPEPSSFVFLALGGAALGLIALRRRIA